MDGGKKRDTVVVFQAKDEEEDAMVCSEEGKEEAMAGGDPNGREVSFPEPIEEELDMWRSREDEQLQRSQSDATDFASQTLKSDRDPDNSSRLTPDQAPTMWDRGDSRYTNTAAVQIKEEVFEVYEVYETPEPDCPKARSDKEEEEERGETLPDPQHIESVRKKATVSRLLPFPRISLGSRIRAKTKTGSRPIAAQEPPQIKEEPDPWSSYCYGDDAGEHVSSDETEGTTAEAHRNIYQSLEEEEEESGGIKPMKSKKSRAKCSRPIPSPRSSPGPCLGSETKQWKSPWSDEESEHVSSEEAENKTEEVNPCQCIECGKTFRFKSELYGHKRVHRELLHACEECGKAFKLKSNLVVHRKIHTGEKTHQCPDCDKCFRQKVNLVNHRRIHTREKSYQCLECDQAFSQRSQLITHRRIHTGEKPFKCEECDSVFIEKSSLVRHQKLHTGEKPFQCPDCDKAFFQNTNLTIHRRIHTGEKPYQCQDCDKAFNQQSSLVRHKRAHL